MSPSGKASYRATPVRESLQVGDVVVVECRITRDLGIVYLYLLRVLILVKAPSTSATWWETRDVL